jgi:hypothetical protein
MFNDIRISADTVTAYKDYLDASGMEVTYSEVVQFGLCFEKCTHDIPSFLFGGVTEAKD